MHVTVANYVYESESDQMKSQEKLLKGCLVNVSRSLNSGCPLSYIFG